MATSIDGSETVGLLACSAILAGMANIKNRFDARTLSDLVTLDSFANLDNDTCTFVTGTLDSQVGHLGHAPIVEHEMDIAQAEASGVELDQNIFGACGCLC